MELRNPNGTSRTLGFHIGDVVIKSLRRLTTGVVTCLHEDVGDFCLVECTISDGEGGLERDTFLGSNSLIGVMRITS